MLFMESGDHSDEYTIRHVSFKHSRLSIIRKFDGAVENIK